MSGRAPDGRRYLILRADGGRHLGMGHLSRCLALGQAWRAQGGSVCLVTGTAAVDLPLTGADLEVVGVEPCEPGAWLSEDDLERTADAARTRMASFVVVDHYGASPSYLDGLRRGGQEVGIIDDLADRDLSAAGWILNQNIGAAALRYSTSPACVRLMGPSYALLRPEFAAARGTLARRFAADDRRVLVTLGGGDSRDACGWVLNGLYRAASRLEVRCIIGVGGDEEVKGRAEASHHEVRVLRRVEAMAEHMSWADLSINAAGSTSLELSCLGVPMVVFALSETEAPNAAGLDGLGCARSLGRWKATDDPAVVGSLAESLLSDPERRKEMSRRGQALTDGLGAGRAAESLRSVASR